MRITQKISNLYKSIKTERDVIAYQVFHPFARPVAKKTDYKRFLRGGRIRTPQVQYISRSFLNTVLLMVALFVSVQIGFIFAGDLIASFSSELPIIPYPSITISIGLGLSYLVYQLYYPIYRRNERRREINAVVPRMLTYMHALAAGGLKAPEIAEQLAETGDIYGEAAFEMKQVVRIANRPGSDIRDGFEEVAKSTPSEQFADLLEEYTSVLNAGSDESAFLKSKAEQGIDLAEEEKERFLDLVEFLSEIYVVILVIAPILLIILAVVMGLYGATNKGLVQAATYFIVPALALCFSIAIYILGKTTGMSWKPLDEVSDHQDYDIEEVDEDIFKSTIYLPHRMRQETEKILRIISRPFSKMRNRPHYVLFITVPITVAYLFYIVQGDMVTLSFDYMAREYYRSTVLLIFEPFVLLFLPVSLLYEWRAREIRRTRRKLPQLFENVAEANFQGLGLKEALRVAANSGSGELYDELKLTVNRADLTDNLNGSLIKFANKMKTARLSQAIRIVTQASNTSSDVQGAIRAIADDLTSQFEIDRDRRQRANMYVLVIILSFLTTVVITVILDIAFLQFVQEQINTSANRPGISGVKVSFFRRMFVHLLVIISITSGINIGLIKTNNIQCGLKYAIAMMTISIVVFPLF